MNNLLTLVGITIVLLLLVGPFFSQAHNTYENYAYGQGYNVIEIKDSEEATEEEEEAMEEAEDEDDD